MHLPAAPFLPPLEQTGAARRVIAAERSAGRNP